MSGLATLLLVREATHSYAIAGFAVGIQAVAIALVGPVQGRLVDRHGRGRVLVPWAAAQTALFVALVLCAHAHAPGIALVLISAAIGAALPAIAPAVRALLRAVIVDDVAREAAYALESVIQELIWITGPLIVGVVIAVGSPSAGAAALRRGCRFPEPCYSSACPPRACAHRLPRTRGPVACVTCPSFAPCCCRSD